MKASLGVTVALLAAAILAGAEGPNSSTSSRIGESQLAETILDSVVLENATADRQDAFVEEVSAVREARKAHEGKERLARAGEWHSRRFDPESRGWQVDLERDDETGSIEGSIRINGSRSLASATKLRGWIKGSSVSGTIDSDSGKVLGTFSGEASAAGMSGTYTTHDGDEGEWALREWKLSGETALDSAAGADQVADEGVTQDLE